MQTRTSSIFIFSQIRHSRRSGRKKDAGFIPLLSLTSLHSSKQFGVMSESAEPNRQTLPPRKADIGVSIVTCWQILWKSR